MYQTKLYEIEEPIKLIQVNRKTFERLKEHNIYFHSGRNNGNSYDDIITTLMDFYEENYNDDDERE